MTRRVNIRRILRTPHLRHALIAMAVAAIVNAHREGWL